MWTRIGRLLVLLPCTLLAGELNFTASVNRTEVGVGEQLMLTVSVAGENMGQIPAPQLPDLPDFDVGGRSSSQSTNIQFINGKVTQQQTISYIYTLYPKKIGTYTIGSCTMEFKGESYRTQPISITVAKGTTQPQQTPTAPGMVPSAPNVPIDENLKLLASTNRSSLYQGEQLTVEFALYTRLNLSNINLADHPTYGGFWSEPIYDANKIDFQKKTIDGKLYNVCLLKKTALFPMTSGQLTISPMQLDVAVVQPPRDFFDFWGTTKTIRISSDPLNINVKPLPSEGKPLSFAGGVGQFAMTATIDRTSSEAAEPITLTLRITGAGNIKLVEKLPIPPIPGVKILDPEISENVNVVNDRLKGYKEFRYPLIPQVDGEHLIPEIEMAYFDPQTKQYITIKTQQLKFTATQTAVAADIEQQTGVKVLGSDIQYIKPDTGTLRAQHDTAGWWTAFVYLFSVVIVSVSILYRKHQSRLLTDRAYARKLRSSRIVRKGLKEAEQYLKNNDEKQFHAALSRVLIGYIGDRYNLDTGALTKDDLFDELKKKNVRLDSIDALSSLMDKCDLMRFSPGTTCDNPDELLRKTKTLLTEL